MTVDKYTKEALLRGEIGQEIIRRRDVLDIEIGRLSPNPNQIRKTMDRGALEELKKSIHSFGILEPLIVRPIDERSYQIVAGERRYKAAIELNLTHLPCIVKKLTDDEAFQISLIENVQRETLSPIEEAEGYKYLLDKKIVKTQKELAEIIGVHRQRINEKLALLSLPDKIKMRVSGRPDTSLSEGLISETHAQYLLKLKDERQQLKLFDEIIKKGLSTRQTKKRVENILNPKACVKKFNPPVVFRQTKTGFFFSVRFNNKLNNLNEIIKEIENLLEKIKSWR